MNVIFGISCEAGDNKTEQWTWTQYLEETKAIAAPTKLFQEVCTSLVFNLQPQPELLLITLSSPQCSLDFFTTSITTTAAPLIGPGGFCWQL